jgi:hypothetical protein
MIEMRVACLLVSLAITPKGLNELNDDYEMERLVDNIKLYLSRIQIGLILHSNIVSILD